MAKQAKDNLLKQKEEGKSLRAAQQEIAAFKDKLEAQAAGMEELKAKLREHGEEHSTSQSQLRSELDNLQS